MSVGMPQAVWLAKFGQIVSDAFDGHVAYQVGSSLDSKEWRDVDVRLLLPDEVFAAMFGLPAGAAVNAKLAAYVLAFAALGKAMTGLPVDFQIQSVSYANDKHAGPRSALIQLTPDTDPST